MRSDLPPHTLLRIAGSDNLETDEHTPTWVAEQLRLAPWVVVRRAPLADALIPVGVRGGRRSERFAAWLRRSAVMKSMSPRQLAKQRGWREHPRSAEVPALAVLDDIEKIMGCSDVGLCWGPVGSVGFELATGVAATNPTSDLDLILQLEGPLEVGRAARLWSDLASFPVRVDVLIEMPHGAVALADLARSRAPYLLRTSEGARLVDDLQAGAAVLKLAERAASSRARA
jgi:phosphoribosyl-dephospho-CoA transferase